MVVAGILALALALPTGALFGIGYGTGVRIGYEQIYPLLFPANKDGIRNTASTVKNVQAINQIYDAIGGKEASQMGIATGLSSAMSELDTNPDFQDLLKLESTLSGNTSPNFADNSLLGKLEIFLQQQDLSSKAAIKTAAENIPASFLDNPVISKDLTADELYYGPITVEEFKDQFSYLKMSRQQLLNNQPSQMSPVPSNLKERQIEWDHVFQLKRDFPTVDSTRTSAYRNALKIFNYDFERNIVSPPSAISQGRATTPVTSQVRKTSIAASGLSPLATSAVNQFKANIDLEIHRLERLNPFSDPLTVQKTIKKLSALRIKFQSTYGYFY